MSKKYVLLFFLIVFSITAVRAQVQERMKPVLVGSSRAVPTQAVSEKVLMPPGGEFKIYNPKKRSSNRVVPGKGYPKNMDAAWQKRMGNVQSKSPLFTFDASSSGSTPTDPTGAVGPNHYVNAWNSGFAIYDKQGNSLLPPADLSSIGGTFEDEDLGDPIVLYDAFADRFLITQYSDTPNGLLVAISKGPDPVNDGWFTYRFNTGSFPDYPKFFIWSDGYYVTTNQDPNEPDIDEVIYVLERDKMLLGEEARHIGLPLPGVMKDAFYSPAGFNAVGDELPPRGNAPIIYFQDDAWMGVNRDHLKLWTVNVDWNDPENSTIEESQELGPAEGVTPFHSTFDGGSFQNLSQPGNSPDVDALQAAIMYPTCYRRFADHNSVVFNFVVDIDPSVVEHAGIRWYELRQDSAGGDWSVYQEGTYAPDQSDRWCGSIGMDQNGNIAMGYTVLNDDAENPVFPSLRYTGRYAGDPLGQMTLVEESIVEGEFPDYSSRYGDYSHMSIDPVDEETFWFIGEYFGNFARLNKVGVFKIAPEYNIDVGIQGIIDPVSSTLGNQEEITVVIRNFGKLPQSNIPVEYSVDGGSVVSEVFPGTLPSTSMVEYTFNTTANLGSIGTNYTITANTALQGDQNPDNDSISVEIENLRAKDIGVTTIQSPETGEDLGVEPVVIIIENFGGEPQSNFQVGYRVDGGEMITETVQETLDVNEEIGYTFSQPVDLSQPRKYEITATTLLSGDSDKSNDQKEKTVANLNCIPVGSDCSFGDGITDFYLQDIVNENIYCTDGYYDFIGLSTKLDRSQRTYVVGVATHFVSGNNSRFSLWIDFNDNAFFDADELLVNAQVIPSSRKVYSYEFTIPEDAPLGEHIMRVRGGDVSPEYDGELNDPCSVMEFGTTQDYTVEIVNSIGDSALKDGDLNVSTTNGKNFSVNFTTSYQSSVWITVHDMLGRKLVENKLEKGVMGYEYDLDMSYVARGVYLVRVGTMDEGRVQRIVVR